MILQALAAYYHRLADEPDSSIPPFGYAEQKVHFALVLDKSGNLVQVQDLRDHMKKKEPVSRALPTGLEDGTRTANPSAHYLWDNTKYVLSRDKGQNMKRAKICFDLFRERIKKITQNEKDEGILAVLSFLDKVVPENPQDSVHWKALAPYWDELENANLVFRLEGDLKFINDRQVPKRCWENFLHNDVENRKLSICLVSGKEELVAGTHMPVKGLYSSGSSLVSFNLDAFKSYGKKQNFNAPISEQSAFAYTTALNHLLSKESRQKIRIGDAATVFWTEKPSPMERLFGFVIDPPSEDEGLTAEIRLMLEAVRDGKLPRDVDPKNGFFLLGLSPNIARLSVRFWHESTVGDAVEKVGQHFRDLAIDPQYQSDPLHPGMWRLLRQTAVQEKSENIPPLLAGAFMRAVITGGLYPQSLLSAIINRIRAGADINYYRAALIKAVLVRKYRITDTQPMEVGMALNEETTNTAYRLGRLFAVLEQAQKDAVPGANATIKDRFYGSASATPGKVFPLLIRLSQHHMSKAEYGWARDKKIEEIMSAINEFPAFLSLEDQGLFALGYYHQRQAFFTKSENKDKKED